MCENRKLKVNGAKRKVLRSSGGRMADMMDWSINNWMLEEVSVFKYPRSHVAAGLGRGRAGGI